MVKLSSCPPEHLSQKNKNVRTHKMCTQDVYRSFIYNGQKLEIAYLFFNGRIIKQSVMHLPYRILLSTTKE